MKAKIDEARNTVKKYIEKSNYTKSEKNAYILKHFFYEECLIDFIDYEKNNLDNKIIDYVQDENGEIEVIFDLPRDLSQYLNRQDYKDTMDNFLMLIKDKMEEDYNTCFEYDLFVGNYIEDIIQSFPTNLNILMADVIKDSSLNYKIKTHYFAFALMLNRTYYFMKKYLKK